MIDTLAISKVLEEAASTITKMADLIKQHNMMLLDLYERVAKLEDSVVETQSVLYENKLGVHLDKSV